MPAAAVIHEQQMLCIIVGCKRYVDEILYFTIMAFYNILGLKLGKNIICNRDKILIYIVNTNNFSNFLLILIDIKVWK